MKKRVISAIVALLIAVPLILIGGLYFKIFAIVLGILSLKEIIDARGTIPSYMKYITYILFLIFVVDGFRLVDSFFSISVELIILSIFTLVMPIFIYKNKEYNINDSIFLIGFLLIFSLVFNSFILVREYSLVTTIYLFLIPILTDTFALLGGSKYGHTKLMPSVSPNKSVEGLIIGVSVCVILSSLFYHFYVNSNTNIIILVIFTILLSVIGEFGDLVFSAIKREYKIKDFSNIMPGHGGILDRLDSIIFVIVAYMLLISIL